VIKEAHRHSRIFLRTFSHLPKPMGPNDYDLYPLPFPYSSLYFTFGEYIEYVYLLWAISFKSGGTICEPHLPLLLFIIVVILWLLMAI